ncbi:MAG: hypothetical protein ACO1O1_05540 [Adhaeribacter sp.]
MPEEELDDLFRKSASEFRPEYDPAAWQAMEEKLDAYRPYPGFWQRFIWLSSLLLIMGLGFGVSLLLQDQQRRQAASQVTAPAPILQKPVPASKNLPTGRPAGGRASAPGLLALPKQPGLPPPNQPQPAQHLQNPQAQDRQAQDRQQQDRQKQKIRQTALPALTPGGRALRRQAFARQTALLPAAPSPQSPQRQTFEDAPGRQPAARLALPDTTGPGQAKTAPDKQQVATLADQQGQPDSLARALPAPGPAADSSAVEKVKRPLASRFSLRLLAAPDLSAVGLRKPEGVGSSAGLELRYQLRPRWYLTAGLLKSHKKYGARPEDYGNHDYWYNRHLPDDIDAVCEVLDLPLQIGYQVVRGEKSAFTIHTGLSSYWMLSEDYHYIYTTGTPYTRTWSVRGQNRHLFSVYNLSGYYARRLTPALEAGIEPFVKLPLAGVGGGKIKLSSAGVYLSLGYRLR